VSARRRPVNAALVGGLTILVVVVAVFLAYNANRGLPFAPTYTLHVKVPDAASLLRGEEVRIAGRRVGIVSSIVPQQDTSTGTVDALITVKVSPSDGNLPADSTAIIRPVSALGSKYLELDPGTSPQRLPSGATLGLASAQPTPVELDQFLNMFDAPTRSAEQQDLVTFGNALAGRGPALSDTIGALAPALGHLAPLGATLAARSTRLAPLVATLDAFTRELAPVAPAQAQTLRDLDATFAALALVTPSLQRSLDAAPPAVDQATRSLAADQPFLDRATRFLALLRPSADALPATAPPLARAVTAGARTLGPATGFARRLSSALGALAAFAGNAGVAQGLDDLAAASTAAQPTVASLAGMQQTCNYLTLALRNLDSLLSEGDSVGGWSRFMILIAPNGPNNEGAPASAPANGPGLDNHLHDNPYPYVGAPGQPAQCEAGNETYAAGRTVIGHSPGGASATHDVTTRAGG
jgi:virulence factor Mce-like protein